MIRRPPRSTLFPYTDALPIYLDEPCRRQQVGEGWFASLSEVPTRAISMTVRQILKAKEILVVVPDARKAQAVRSCFEGDRKSTRLNSSHSQISYAVFCLKKKK